MDKWKLALASLIALAAISGLSWDVYVFIESTRLFLHGIDPYKLSNEPLAYSPGLGPMWIAYPPLPIFLWAVFEIPLVLAKVPLSAWYVLAIKMPSILSLIGSTYVVKKMGGNWKWVLFNPISIVAIFIHGMFDSIVAFFLLVTIYFLIKENDSLKGGLAYGLALATKQHALLAIPPLMGYFYKKKDYKGFVAFVLGSVFLFTIVTLIYSSMFNFTDINDLLKTIFMFHAKRPPNGLGFGGFAVINFYGDTFSYFTGNTAVGLYMRGTTVALSSVVDKAGLPFLIAFFATAFMGLIEGIFIVYLSYILLSYVGAVQHLVVPAVIAGIALNNEKDILKKLFFTSLFFYATEHLLAFWDFFPMIVEPLFLKSFGLWSGLLSRVFDVYTPAWDVFLRTYGIVGTSIALITLLTFVTLYYSEKLRREAIFLIPSLYILEIILLGLLMNTLTISSPTSQEIIHAKKWCLLVPWENLEYPGHKFGDYLSSFAVPLYGYYSFVMPIAKKLVSSVEHRCNLALLVRLDLFRGYQYTDLIAEIMKKGLTYAWVIVLSNNTSYINGIASSPTVQLNRTFHIVVRNIPLAGYFKMGGVMGFMNNFFHFIKPKVYKGYLTEHGKPIIFVIGKPSKSLLDLAKRYNIVLKPFTGEILNIKGAALSISGG